MTPAPQDQLSQDLASLKIDRGPKPRGSEAVRHRARARGSPGSARIGYFVVVPEDPSALFTPRGARPARSRWCRRSQAQVQLTATGLRRRAVSAKVAAKVPGRIAEIFVEEGQRREGRRRSRGSRTPTQRARSPRRGRAPPRRGRGSQIARASARRDQASQIEREKPLVEKGVTAKAHARRPRGARRRRSARREGRRGRGRRRRRRDAEPRGPARQLPDHDADRRHRGRQARRGRRGRVARLRHARRRRGRRLRLARRRDRRPRGAARPGRASAARARSSSTRTRRSASRRGQGDRPPRQPRQGDRAGEGRVRRQAPEAACCPRWRRA